MKYVPASRVEQRWPSRKIFHDPVFRGHRYNPLYPRDQVMPLRQARGLINYGARYHYRRK